MSDPSAPRRPPRDSDLSSAAMRVAEIVAAAELAAAELRATAERRATERIAEADRAAAMRVDAADAEAIELRGEGAEQAQQARDKAADDARKVLGEARKAAREVLHEGEQISGHLRELADALRVNAERLLRDIRLAHAELASRLDQAEPQPRNDRGYAPRASRDERQVELDVPEFIPRDVR